MCNKYYSVCNLNFAQKGEKVDFENLKVRNLISAVFPIVRVPKNRTNRGSHIEPVSILNSKS